MRRSPIIKCKLPNLKLALSRNINLTIAEARPAITRMDGSLFLTMVTVNYFISAELFLIKSHRVITTWHITKSSGSIQLPAMAGLFPEARIGAQQANAYAITHTET